MLDIRLILFGGLEGVLCHEQIGPPRPWRREDHVFGIAIANFAALAIEHNERKRDRRALRDLTVGHPGPVDMLRTRRIGFAPMSIDSRARSASATSITPKRWTPPRLTSGGGSGAPRVTRSAPSPMRSRDCPARTSKSDVWETAEPVRSFSSAPITTRSEEAPAPTTTPAGSRHCWN